MNVMSRRSCSSDGESRLFLLTLFKIYREAALATGIDIPDKSVSHWESNRLLLKMIPLSTASANTWSILSKRPARNNVAMQSVKVMISGEAELLAVATVLEFGVKVLDDLPIISSHSS